MVITFGLGVDDLADTRFAISPLNEVMLSLRVLREPGLSAVHLPWRARTLRRLTGLDTDLLHSLVGPQLTLPDFLTPRTPSFDPTIEDELAAVADIPAAVVRRDLRTVHPADAPAPVRRAIEDDAAATELRDRVCTLLAEYWRLSIAPDWSAMRQVLEADMTYRARRLTTGGARALFADIHPHVTWRDGVLRIDKMLLDHHVEAAGRGLLLVPTVFAHKPAPPASADEAPILLYPSRGVATLWAGRAEPTPGALAALLGAPRARLLALLGDPLSTTDAAGICGVTPSAVSQHLRVLHANGLVNRARSGRSVLYRRTALGEDLIGGR